VKGQQLPQPGGPAAKAGILFERWWTMLALLEVLAGKAQSLEIEVLGKEGEGTEFALMINGVPHWHQVKLTGRWSISQLRTKGVLDHWWAKIQSGGFFEFVCRAGAEEMDELIKRASNAESWAAFDASLVSDTQRNRFIQLCAAWQASSGEAAYEALRKSAVHSIDEYKLIELVEARLASLVMGLSHIAAGELARLIDESPHRRLTADYAWDWLSRNGVRQKPRTPLGTPPRLLLASIASLLMIAGGGIAVGLVLTSPSYVNLSTGPSSGISVATIGKACGNTPQNGLRSPAATRFSAISLAYSQVLDGNDIRVYQGTYNGKSYDWLQSDITGSLAEARLTWYMPPHFKYAYWCNLSIPDKPIRTILAQVATVAIPTLIDDKEITFKACVWHSAPFSEKCSSILP